MHYFNKFHSDRSSFDNNVRHLLIPAAGIRSPKKSDEPPITTVIQSLVDKFSVSENRLRSMLKKDPTINYHLDDILMIADMCGLPPDKVLARLLDENSFANATPSQKSILDFHDCLDLYDRRDIRKNLYDDESNREENLKFFVTLMKVFKLDPKKRKLVFLLIEQLS